MDRDRLKEVHKTETTESRVNEDFVEWLKNKGPTWLLVGLVALTVYLGSVRWTASRQAQHIQAWHALSEAEVSALPASFEAVAEDFPRVDGIAVVARLKSAQRLLRAVQAGEPVTPDVTAEEPEPLSDELREQYLERADRQYQMVLDADDATLRMTVHAVNALNGRAAVAEARDDLEAARGFYRAAAERAETTYPALANQARNRAERVELAAARVTLPSSDEVDTPAAIDPDLRPARIDSSLRNLMLPDEPTVIRP